ncbi:C40 family peptidase [Leifsonia aquatica]|uniref:NlpC/P60 family protein n=2 Tax=Leifsonia aquatica TaxID=144185 RepID=U2RS72_LEIAQ|nr:C40 family peptidase [Leifsonia aquatica]ERK71404.1 NlpC/P60 family protein [Leifsonia aquatica ATCC 14665]MBB2968085.1 cell wall-associated NlpC family hydrolase [Leifsonia aquatica]
MATSGRARHRIEAGTTRAGRRRAEKPETASRSDDRHRTGRAAAFTASAAALALIGVVAVVPPADAATSATALVDASMLASSSSSAGGSGATKSQHLALARFAASTISRDTPVASALAGVVQSEGGAAGDQAASAIMDSLAAGGARAAIVNAALSYLGTPYVLGGASHSGIDCSGLVMEAYAAAGISLGHLVHLQDDAGTVIPESEAKPGDLVVFDDEEHIGIYLGNGTLIHAPDVGRDVSITTVWQGVAHHFTRILPG